MQQETQTAQVKDHCGNAPYFDRLNYHYGQMLGVRDFCTAHDYFHNKLKLINRCLHGYGVVCGLAVGSGVHDCIPVLTIESGVALDIHGNEIVVRQTSILPVSELVCREEFYVKDGAPSTFEGTYLTICFEEKAIEPQQVDCSDTCRASNTMTYARKRDCPRICITKAKPPSIAEETCDPCCNPPDESCLWLAKIELKWDGEHFLVSEKSIDNSIRRPVSLYRPTTITGINWVHGACYSESEIEELESLNIRFSRPIRSKTVVDGVLDVWVIDDWNNSRGQFRSCKFKISPCESDFTNEIEFVFDENEGFGPNDRVIIELRTDFLLDRCGRAVDGNHIGGMVPLMEHSKVSDEVKNQKAVPSDIMPPGSWGPWQSGNGTPSGTFVSWFFVKKRSQSPQTKNTGKIGDH